MDFPHDEARRGHFRNSLLTALASPDFKKRLGFPFGEDATIIELSDPPYFTACPNPFLGDMIAALKQRNGSTEPYSRDPFAADVSEGRGDAMYNAHGYHTKVPHRALMRYILHYTSPGDVVFDGFCGTGMTGLAAMMCSDKAVVESLGYRVAPSGDVLDDEKNVISRLGYRNAVLSDLSPIAAFIAANYSTPQQPDSYSAQCDAILTGIEKEHGWMLRTLHSASSSDVRDAIGRLAKSDFRGRVESAANGRIHYVIWSDVFSCQHCGEHMIYWSEAVDVDRGKVRDAFPCPKCKASVTKRSLDRVWDSYLDPILGKVERIAKAAPVLINYTYAGKTFEKVPDEFDLAILAKIRSLPTAPLFPKAEIQKGDKTGDPFAVGIRYVHQYFTPRNLWLISSLWNVAASLPEKWAVTAIMQRASRQHQIAITRIGGEKAGEGGATAGHRRGTLYIPSNQVEFNPLDLFDERTKTMAQGFGKTASMERRVFVSVNSARSVGLPDQSVDYVFVDPPFGGNIMYSELNFAWEAMLGVVTNSSDEAVQNKTQDKRLLEYQELMTGCFQEFYRVLKSGRWMTVEFHNSKNAVWNAIQEALQRAGFVVADVRMLDKKIKTHTQRTAAGSVDQDLVISSYKPSVELERAFRLESGTAEGAWKFVVAHLRNVPVAVVVDGRLEVLAERQKQLLYDRMVAFHVQRGIALPLSAAEFYEGIHRRLPERDGMYFTPEQVVEYDKKRMSVSQLLQLELFVSDEASAIQWLRQQLTEKPQTFQEIQPRFLQEVAGWQKCEEPLELLHLLEENFLRYEGEGEIPSQVHRYLSSNFHDLRNRSKSDESLRAKAKNRWYVPDAKKEADLEQVRHRALLKEFSHYVDGKAKLKVVRSESLRAGFAGCWQKADYETILQVARRVPETIIQEDPALLMYFDNALIRTKG